MEPVDVVEPFGDYGATLQLHILLIQAGAYGLSLIFFICKCKNEPDAEPIEAGPEEDVF